MEQADLTFHYIKKWLIPPKSLHEVSYLSTLQIEKQNWEDPRVGSGAGSEKSGCTQLNQFLEHSSFSTQTVGKFKDKSKADEGRTQA